MKSSVPRDLIRVVHIDSLRFAVKYMEMSGTKTFILTCERGAGKVRATVEKIDAELARRKAQGHE